jgi:hypothetical protein
LTPPSHNLVNLRNNQQLHHLHLLIMLFKCGLCTFIMDSRVHGNLPCDMCGEENPKRIPLDPSEWDIFLADDYNSLFPPCVADFRRAIGRPINDVDGGVVASSRQLPPTATMPGGSDSMATPLVDKKSAAATAKSTDTSAPQKKKPRTLKPTVGEEGLTCSCATCVFLWERTQKLKRGGFAWDK